ncbi:MAG: transglycosylase SLT domain-containing protein [Candidatus Falkowbacteria bacterium]|nr:transglycosylase SLT domain-containing protein [Candidatus Falkowbacteria bacterium]
MIKNKRIFLNTFLISFIFCYGIFFVSIARAESGCCCYGFGEYKRCQTLDSLTCKKCDKEGNCGEFEAGKVPSSDKTKCVNSPTTTTNNLPNLKLDAPDLKVSIPGMDKLQPVTCTESGCSIPWLAQYIGGLQKYAIGVIGIIAAITIMLGGIIWLTAAGSSQKIADAKKWIIGGLSGLALVLGSYLLLYSINPKLTVLNNLEITRITKYDLSELVFEGHEPMFDPKNAKPITDTTYDETFKNFAACIGIDWRIFKSIAYKESGLNPKIVNKFGFTGLFQTKKKYCPETLRELGLDVKLCDNPGITDPFVNTAIATAMMKSHKKTIESKCSSSSDNTKMYMTYFGNANGGGALKSAINKYGCGVGSWPESIHKGATLDYNKQVVETMLAQGVTKYTDTAGNGKCPDKK